MIKSDFSQKKRSFLKADFVALRLAFGPKIDTVDVVLSEESKNDLISIAPKKVLFSSVKLPNS